MLSASRVTRCILRSNPPKSIFTSTAARASAPAPPERPPRGAAARSAASAAASLSTSRLIGSFSSSESDTLYSDAAFSRSVAEPPCTYPPRKISFFPSEIGFAVDIAAHRVLLFFRERHAVQRRGVLPQRGRAALHVPAEENQLFPVRRPPWRERAEKQIIVQSMFLSSLRRDDKDVRAQIMVLLRISKPLPIRRNFGAKNIAGVVRRDLSRLPAARVHHVQAVVRACEVHGFRIWHPAHAQFLVIRVGKLFGVVAFGIRNPNGIVPSLVAQIRDPLAVRRPHRLCLARITVRHPRRIAMLRRNRKNLAVRGNRSALSRRRKVVTIRFAVDIQHLKIVFLVVRGDVDLHFAALACRRV